LAPDKFNSIGVKLAQRADVPVVPVALVTDAWPNGKLLKDFGKIDPTKTVRFSFGAPILIKGRGTDQNQQIIRFITTTLEAWQQAGADAVDACRNQTP
jgi:1-acyl-sn-glycerol-3-phosphate acyltransferase